MAGYPLLVELENVEGSPSPSWPATLSQKTTSASFPLLVRGFTVAIMAGSLSQTSYGFS